MSERSETPDFPDPSFVIDILLKQGYYKGRDREDIKSDPEFQVFRIIGQNNSITTEAIESKFEITNSLSMILSNLQADGLISQTSNYQWKISDFAWEFINKATKIEQKHEQVQEQEQVRRESLREINLKKTLYKKIADQLVGTTYLPSKFTIEDLFKIPEIEILAIIFQAGAISAQQIEETITMDTSISLALSNLQADQIINQNSEYDWEISQSILKEINDTIIEVKGLDNAEGQQFSPGGLQSQSEIIEHKQLLKAILDINYFPGKRVNEILGTSEFEILSIINSFSPITSDEIEAKLTHETLVSLLLSNLSADNLVEQTNDIRWILTEEFRAKVSKVKVSQNEIMEQIRLDEERYINQPDSQNPTEITTKIENEPPRIIERPIENRSAETVETISDPIIRALTKFKYLDNPQMVKSELSMVPEYVILTIISENQPIDADEIGELSNISSVSLTLSNLQADNLIQQTNDYKYQLHVEAFKELPTLLRPKEEESSVQPVMPAGQVEAANLTQIVPQSQPQASQKRSLSEILELVKASYKAGYIEKKEEKIENLVKIPESEVLKIIYERGSLTEDELKTLTTSVSPVLISRTLSRLEAERRIHRNDQQKWELTLDFQELLIEDRLKEESRQAEIKAQKEEAEQKLRLEAEREQRQKFIELLRGEGIVQDVESQEALMQIPEFEILWIIARAGKEISESEIKDLAESTSPVLITRTLVQLETRGRVQKTLSGKYDLSPDLKK